MRKPAMITVEATLFPGLGSMVYKGISKPVFQKSILMGITPQMLNLIINKSNIEISGIMCQIDSYNEKTNTINARGHMNLKDSLANENLLTKNGWIMKKDG